MTCLLFPGQGSQRPGMGRDFYDRSPAARDSFDEVENLLGPGFLDRLFGADTDALQDTRLTQPALVAVEIAIAAHLTAAGINFDTVAGHSVGEIAALVAAGSLDAPTALRLTQERARLMAEETPPGGMVAVIGIPAQKLEDHLPDGLEVANFNGPEQTILSGPSQAIASADETLAGLHPKRIIALAVSGPFHCSLMKHAATAYRSCLEAVEVLSPKCHFVSSVSGQRETDPARIRDLLGDQLERPVRWTDVMATLGDIEAFETGPGNVLRGLARRTPGAPAVSPLGTHEQAEAFLTHAGQEEPTR